MGALAEGSTAPDFELQDQEGNAVRLSDLRGSKVLVYFYPMADTPGCTQQSCAVRDARQELGSLNARVLGISPDPPDAQQRFDQKYSLGFPLLADTEHSVCEAYGVWGEQEYKGHTWTGVKRSSFLIDENGRVARAWYGISPGDTVPKALEALSS